MKKQALQDAAQYIDGFLGYLFGELEVPSLSYAIVHKGEVVHSAALGDAVIGKEAATPATRYRVASNSKMFTGVAILQLQENKKLRLDDTAASHITWLAEHTDERWRQVTIRQLLSHTAGCIRDSSQSGFWALEYEFPDAEALRQQVLHDELVFDENTTMKYSNYGFGLLGQIIESVSGQRYAAYVDEHIIKPLGLANTTMEYDAQYSHQSATGYTGLTPGVRRHIPIEPINTRALAAATGCMSTPTDLALFVSRLFSETSEILMPASVRELHRIHAKVKYSEQTDRFYGLGFELGEYDGKDSVGHGGGFPGQLTQTIAIPQDDIAVSVTINTYGQPPLVVAKSILNALYWFDSQYVAEPKQDLRRFTFRTGHLWGATDNVGYGDTLVCVPTKLPLDFSYAERMERVDDTTVKITDTSSFLSPGETMKYVFDEQGVVRYIDEQGVKLYGAEARDKLWAGLKKISIGAKRQ